MQAARRRCRGHAQVCVAQVWPENSQRQPTVPRVEQSGLAACCHCTPLRALQSAIGRCGVACTPHHARNSLGLERAKKIIMFCFNHRAQHASTEDFDLMLSIVENMLNESVSMGDSVVVASML
jgi:hypothetical protein